MSWLDSLNEKETRRLAGRLRHRALDGRDLAQHQLAHLATQAGGIARAAARDVADYGRHEGADVLRDTASHYAHRASELADRSIHRAGDLAHRAMDYGRAEGSVIAREAAQQMLRVGRAAKADPIPVVVGAVGLALFAMLLFGRRSRR